MVAAFCWLHMLLQLVLKMVVFVWLRGVRPLHNLSLWQLFVGCMGVVARWLGLGVCKFWSCVYDVHCQAWRVFVARLGVE